jgi:hypothetical protein
VTKVRDVGPRTDTISRISAASSAIGTFKSGTVFNKVNYIPPGRVIVDNSTTPPSYTWTTFRLRDTYTQTTTPSINDFEAQYIIALFGVRPTLNVSNQPEILTLGNPGMTADLDANQTLTFFLTGMPIVSAAGDTAAFTGFSMNSQRPFTPRAQADETRKGPILDPGNGKYRIDSGVASLIDAYGTPLAYFAAYDGQANKYYGGCNTRAEFNGVQPYSSVTGSQRQYQNASGFQLISAGKNKTFGTSGDWNNVGQIGEDDLANFSSSQLGAGPQ